MLPLSVAVIPWGILAGSAAINAGLSVMQAVGMSALVFAGAAQLVSLSMLMTGASLLSILITVFFLTSQHFIYALSLREEVKPWSLKRRLSIGFLLTDELYATAMLKEKKWEVRNVKVDGGCYEVYAIDDKGERVEAYFHPVTLEPVKTATE